MNLCEHVRQGVRPGTRHESCRRTRRSGRQREVPRKTNQHLTHKVDEPNGRGDDAANTTLGSKFTFLLHFPKSPL